MGAEVGGEVTIYYERGRDERRVEWQLTFDDKRRLIDVLMVTPPSLAKAELRATMGVTKPWPPRGE